MDCSTLGFTVHPQLPEHTQTHVHWVDAAIQPSHPLSSPSPAFNLPQHQGLFQGVSSSHRVAKVLGVPVSASILPMNERKWEVKSVSCDQLLVTPWIVDFQAPLSMGFSRHENSNGLPFSSPGDLPNIGTEPRSPALQADALPSEPPGKPYEYSGPISFRIDWLNLLAVRRTLKSFLQHNSSKASVLQCSAFFIVQLSHPYMTTGKTIALTRWTFVSKVMSAF